MMEKMSRNLLLGWIFLFAWLFEGELVSSQIYRCGYTAEDGAQLEFVLRDSFSVVNFGRVLSVHRYRKGQAGDSVLCFSRDSLHRSYALSFHGLPKDKYIAPRVVERCGNRYLVFWMERRRTDVTLLNAEIHLMALPLGIGQGAELVVEGRPMVLAMDSLTSQTENRFFVDRKFLLAGDSCLASFLSDCLAESKLFASYADVPLRHVRNYGLAWERLNGVSALSDMERVNFVYYAQPFFPMKPTRTIESENFKVVAFPYGDLLGYDKKKKLYFVIWASEALPREDYSSALAWKKGSSSELLLLGFYDRTVRYLNLETGALTTE